MGWLTACFQEISLSLQKKVYIPEARLVEGSMWFFSFFLPSFSHVLLFPYWIHGDTIKISEIKNCKIKYEGKKSSIPKIALEIYEYALYWLDDIVFEQIS